jgi:hypothetical protein
MPGEFHNFYENTGYTGKLFEEEAFGRCGGSWDGKTHLDFDDSIEYAKANQPPGWRTTDPAPRFSGDLFATVALKLGLEDWSELKLYSAVGSPLDRFHSIDAFFEYKGEIVTVDVTLDDAKKEYRADFIINPNTTDFEIAAIGIADRMNYRIKKTKKVA